MSHYPSTAELSAFRRAVMPSWFDNPYPHAYTAWADEVKCGIGYSGGSPTAPFLVHEADGGPFPMGYAVSCAWADAYDHSWARKAAGAMRSRSYGATFPHTWESCVYGQLCPQDECNGWDCSVHGVHNAPNGPGCACYTDAPSC